MKNIQIHPVVLATVVSALTNLFLPLCSIAESPDNEDSASVLDIIDFGATPDDDTDDTAAIKATLKRAQKNGGGVVRIPAGTFIVSRQASEACILEVPSNTTVRGDGTASILKFPDRVNETNFWRMIGSYRAVKNVAIRDLAIDGSNTLTKYEPGTTFEQNHGIWFYAADGQSTNITIDNVYSHHFSGDCIALGRGSVASVIRDCSFHDGLRCGNCRNERRSRFRKLRSTVTHPLSKPLRPVREHRRQEPVRRLTSVVQENVNEAYGQSGNRTIGSFYTTLLHAIGYDNHSLADA